MPVRSIGFQEHIDGNFAALPVRANISNECLITKALINEGKENVKNQGTTSKVNKPQVKTPTTVKPKTPTKPTTTAKPKTPTKPTTTAKLKTPAKPTTPTKPITPEKKGNPKAVPNVSQAKDESITISKTPSSVKVKVKKNKARISWKKLKKKKKKDKVLYKKIKSIQIQYSIDKTFTKNVKNKKVGRNKAKIKLSLQKKKTYYIRMRYVGYNGFSCWSKVKRIKTK